MQKIIKKFTREHFEIKDNVVDKNLTLLITKFSFAKRQQLHFVIDDIDTFFAKQFT